METCFWRPPSGSQGYTALIKEVACDPREKRAREVKSSGGRVDGQCYGHISIGQLQQESLLTHETLHADV